LLSGVPTPAWRSFLFAIDRSRIARASSRQCPAFCPCLTHPQAPPRASLAATMIEKPEPGEQSLSAPKQWRSEVLVFGRPLQHLVWIDPVDDAERRRVAGGPTLDLHHLDQFDQRDLAGVLLGEFAVVIVQPIEGSPKADRRTHQGAP